MLKREDMPIFIVGAPRSGTTLLRLMLDSHPNISSGPETHFLVKFKSILGSDWRRLKRYGFEKTYWQEKIADFFSSFQMDYARKRGKIRWAEKTPKYALHPDFINGIFPESQIIHIIRDGRDVVNSYRDRWGYVRAIGGIEAWRRYILAAKKFARTVTGERFYELHYEDLVNDAEGTMGKLLEFLHEPWSDQVLSYDSIHHDHGARYKKFTQGRRVQGEDKKNIYASRIGVGKRELGPFLKVLFSIRSGRLLKELGYH